MKMRIFALLMALCLLVASVAFAEGELPGTGVAPAPEPAVSGEAPDGVVTTTAHRWFVNRYKTVRGVTVTYYDNVYAINHGEYALTPFADVVPAEYFVVDANGDYAVAPIVLDIADAMRTRLYGGETGKLAMLYGQYCERVKGSKGRVGFSGIHEGVDFIAKPGAQLYAILGGEVTRAGDSNGTVGVYNEEYDVTVLYLHCEKISVRRGDVIEAGAPIAVEGNKGSGDSYTHVELRAGRHTSSSAYRDTKVNSDCPYPVMQAALGVSASDREPVTYETVLAERRRLAEEEAARALELQAQAQAQQAPLPEETPDVPLIDELPGTADGYGFAAETPAPEETEPTPVPEATLPPA